AKETVPDLPLHISTQANNTNYQSARFWYEQGAERIVVARELSLEEIKEIKQKAPEKLELEAFVHGAMCISYSGRCLLSNYMAGRDANLGACTHPCRWKYHLVEETRPGEYMPVTEDEQGTYIFNSKDLCMIEYIPELIQAGIQSLKIEGRMKTSLYVATVVKTYREAIDDFFQDSLQYEKKKPYYVNELKKCNYRPFTTGFYIQKPKATEQIYDNNTYIRDYTFVGLVIDYNEDTQIATIQQRNKFAIGDELEIVRQKKDNFIYHVNQMWDEEGQEISAAPHPKQVIQLKIDQNVQKYDILRKKE
ncbi:MAG: U32 family peptidase, partial [Epulopiscium sp.]|nr:U32 family peptidase [Candidatus Epulonipiscium sp.]